MLEKQQKRLKRHKRVRAKISGTTEIPRLCVFRSNKHIYVQLIDDERSETLESASDLEIKKLKNKTPKKTKEKQTREVSTAYEVGRLIAQKAIEKKIKKIVFDRGGYKYHGRVKALADGAREGGLSF